VKRHYPYPSETQEAKLDPVEIAISEEERVDISVWAEVALLAVGGGLLLTGRKR